MANPERGEVWLADLGYVAKTRPVLVLSIPFSNTDYALYTVVPHTTTTRRTDFKVKLTVSGLK